MSKDDLFEVMKRINIAYGTSKFPITDEMIDVWYEMLCDYDYEIMQEATKRFILKSDFPPTISGLAKEYDEIIEENNVTKRKLNEWWDGIKSVYPRAFKGCENDYTLAREYYDRLTLNDPDRGSALYTKVCVDIRKSELNHTDLPTLQEYLEGVKTK